MKLDDLARTHAKAAQDSTRGATPASPDDIAGHARRRSLLARGGGVVAVTAIILGLAGVTSLIGTDEPVPPRISDPVGTTNVTTTITLPPASIGVPVVPGLDEATAANLEALPHPGVTVLTEATLTDALVAEIRSAVDGIDFSDRNEPLQVHAAFEKDGVIHTTIEYSSDQTAYMVVEDGSATRFRQDTGTWIDVHGIRKDGTASWFAFTQVTWLGLPDGAATARLTTPQRLDDIEDQAVIGNAAFFEIAKPDWTQIGTLTLYDADGEVLLIDETRLHGTGCSASGLMPITVDISLPDALDAGRVALGRATDQCRPATIAWLAVGSGPYFDLPTDDLAGALREADQRQGLFKEISHAVRFGPQVIETETGTIYQFSWANAELDYGIEIGFSEDGVWQYGRFVDR